MTQRDIDTSEVLRALRSRIEALPAGAREAALGTLAPGMLAVIEAAARCQETAEWEPFAASVPHADGWDALEAALDALAALALDVLPAS